MSLPLYSRPLLDVLAGGPGRALPPPVEISDFPLPPPTILLLGEDSNILTAADLELPLLSSLDTGTAAPPMRLAMAWAAAAAAAVAAASELGEPPLLEVCCCTMFLRNSRYMEAGSRPLPPVPGDEVVAIDGGG